MPQTAPRFFKEFDLAQARSSPSQRRPAEHQTEALGKLLKWYRSSLEGRRASKRVPTPIGGMLVLPTGGGKTFSALRFCCKGPLSNGYKVLWLAHTHYLLEQAFHGLAAQEGSTDGHEIGHIEAPRAKLKARVVSSTPGHCEVRNIKSDDDFLIATLQTIANADQSQQQHWVSFLKASEKTGLFVVFDEAHHSPAPTYQKLIGSLQEHHPNVMLLGLTATPTYSDERRRGWLAKLFPQSIIHQAEVQALMAAGVLAKPHVEECETSFEAQFSDDEYSKWVRGPFRDLPESVVEHLATNAKRNEFIANHYAQNMERYGRTIIFADRWFQCEAICKSLDLRGVKAAAMYSQVDVAIDANLARARRAPDANDVALKRFRDGEIQVLVNIRMLTEGVDVPEAQTVFLTRQTTSAILLTQMVGRALRGPKFGGTECAYIVSFIDNWREVIQWARFEVPRGAEGDAPVGARVDRAVELVSIGLVRRLAEALDSGESVSTAPFASLMPIGWYEVEYESTVEHAGDARGDDVDSVRRLVMVFDGERQRFEALLADPVLSARFGAVDLDPLALESEVVRLRAKHFGGASERPGGNLQQAVFDLARHRAQRGVAPTFHAFDARAHHDVDALARAYIEHDLGPRALLVETQREFAREDRYWSSLFRTFERFKRMVDDTINRLQSPHSPSPSIEVLQQSEVGPGDRLVPPELRAEILRRDGRCLGCGETREGVLQIDHIVPHYHGGDLVESNLQVLCRTCNQRKLAATIDFRAYRSPLSAMPKVVVPDMPEAPQVSAPETWNQMLKREANFLFSCGAVEEVFVGYHELAPKWEMMLVDGLHLEWLKTHLSAVFQVARTHLHARSLPVPDSLVIKSGSDQMVIHEPGRAAARERGYFDQIVSQITTKAIESSRQQKQQEPQKQQKQQEPQKQQKQQKQQKLKK
jgi:superfamily II DNA or RNA helicase